MKWKKRIGLFFLTLAVGTVPTVPVLADGASAVRIEAKNDSAGVTASCVLEKTSMVTNGKIRIHYNPNELVLVETTAGGAISDTLVQINDPLTGNKAPGEIVLVFASAKPVEAKGALIDMEFKQGEAFDSDSGSEIQISIEELVSDGTDLEVLAENGIVPGKQQYEPPAEKPDQEEPGGTDGSKEEENSPSNEKDEQDNGEEGSQKVDSKNSAASTSEAKKTSVSAKSKAKTVKTGDDMNIAVPLAAAVFALGVIGVLVKKKRIEH